jgi:DNA (cytosine-5)-methyltransferase 1
MPRKILVADLFCGAGGSSTGCRDALADLGLEMELVCVNHWGVAIETHRRNHPHARHYCQDIATVRPSEVVPEGYLDLLLASPSCTHHSAARGGKPTSDQQRSDPWHIITWLTELRVKRLIVENVPEYVSWGPVDPRTQRPIKSRKGEYFNAWVNAIRALGGVWEHRILNAADYGDATTRRRFIGQARFDGKPISWPQPTHFKRQEGVTLFPGSQTWRAAREIIDWSIKGNSIFGRKKPLSANTLRRIYAGAVKFRWPDPFLVILRNHMEAQSVELPVPAITASGTHIGLAQPVILSQHNSGAPRGASDPLPTITTGGAAAPDHPGCARPMLVEPFMLSRQGGGVARGIDEPTPTQVAKHSHALIAPYYGSGSGETCTSTDDPLPTATAKARFGMVTPITHADGGADRSRDVDADPLHTITTAHRGEIAFITASFGEREGQAPRVHDIANPTPTIPAKGRINLAEPGEGYDILFRMLEPHELAAAMSLDDYEFAGTKTEKVKQIGNAVPRRLSKALCGAALSDAAPRTKPADQRKREVA